MQSKRIIAAIAALLVVTAAAAAYMLTREKYEKHTESMLDVFDTVITLVAYTKDDAEFERYYDYAYERFHELHRLYDYYNRYDGLNNMVTINENAGIAPVKVSGDIIDLILFSKELYYKTGGKTNIAMGSVLSIWHDYREEGSNDPDNARIPDLALLKDAAAHTAIEDVVVDESAGTVYLKDPRMRLDVGAVAKGYAAEKVMDELISMGMESGIISAGGNVKTAGKPKDGIRDRWGVGIQDPGKTIFSAEEDLLDVVYVNDASVVTSGDYQRYYIVGDKVLHHLIDPQTLMPAEYFASVTVLAEDSGLADFMSTTLFMMPIDEGRRLLERMGGIDALWVLHDGSTDATDGMLSKLKSNGASGSDKR